MRCKECNKEYEHNHYSYPGYCSYKCYERYIKYHKEPNCTCPVCGTHFYIKPYRIRKTVHQVCCSKECNNKYRSQWFSGVGNHQYGLVGKLNSSFKSDKRISVYGYVLVYSPNHPFRNIDDHVFEHRLVIEKNADSFDDKYFIVVEGKKYLRREYNVHHINENKADNRLENLSIMTKSEHRILHNRMRPRVRNEYGRFIKNTMI